MLRLRSFLMVGALVAVAGCGAEDERDPRAVDHLSTELTPIVQGNNDFAFSLYGAASKAQPEGNLFFSPFSVSAAFGMTWAGAAGETADQMRTALSIPEGDAAVYHESFGALIRDLSGEHAGRGYQLYLADRLFGQTGMPFEKPFTDLVKKDYAAPLDSIDYASPDVAVSHINQWVSDNTKKKIPELLTTEQVNSDTRLVLANAIYFKAHWATEFNPSNTHDAAFHLQGGGAVQAPMMTLSGDKVLMGGDPTGDPSGDHVQVMEKKYADGDLSMVVLLPSSADGLPALEAKLSRAYVDGLLANAYETEAQVSLPRWESGLELPLTQLLKDMGMTSAFDSEKADFSNIAGPSSGLYLSFAVHKAFVHVDEEGTEAAAATAVGMNDLGEPEPFVADHPFVYLIRDRLTGSILFVGRMTDPTDKGTL